MNNVLEIKNYSKIYSGNKKAVDNLNLMVNAGEIHAFIGHNGAGKTTTIRAVVGIMDFDKGEILINGHSVKDEPVKCKSMTAYIPDNPGVSIMKRLAALVLTLVYVLGLVGCGATQKSMDEAITGDLPPILIMGGQHYFGNTMPISELSDDFEFMGQITEEEANDTGLQGCKYYANKYLNSFDEFYVYQECGTPVDENTVDSTKRQWAYVKWVREGFESPAHHAGTPNA